MKFYFKQNLREDLPIEEDLVKPDLDEDIKKTRYALEIAYSGFDNAVEPDLIDSYIYEINSLQKRYDHLVECSEALKATESADWKGSQLTSKALRQKSPIKALVSHVFG